MDETLLFDASCVAPIKSGTQFLRQTPNDALQCATFSLKPARIAVAFLKQQNENCMLCIIMCVIKFIIALYTAHHKIEYSNRNAHTQRNMPFQIKSQRITHIFNGSPIKINDTMHDLPQYICIDWLRCLHIPMISSVSLFSCIRNAVIQ